MLNWRQSTKNTKVELYSEVILWKMVRDLKQYSLNKGHQHHKWQQQQSWYHIQTARVRRTSSWCSIRLYLGKNGRCSKIIEKSTIGMPRHLDSSTTTQMAKIMVQYGRSSRSSWAKSVRSSFGRTVMGKTIWENPIEVRLGEKVQIGNVSLYIVKKVHSYVYVHDIKLAGKKQNLDPTWEVLNKEVDLGEPTSFLDHADLGCNSKTMWNMQRYCWQLQNHVWITNFRGVNRKTTILGKSSYLFMALRYGRSCQEMCGTILWVGKQDDSTTLQRINPMPWRPSLQRRKIEIRGRTVKSMLSNCSEIFILGNNKKTWYSMVSEQNCTIDYKMDQGLWQTIESFDLLHPSHIWLRTILLWVILPNNAGWDCFNTPILHEILKIQNLHQVELCAFSEVIHLFR